MRKIAKFILRNMRKIAKFILKNMRKIAFSCRNQEKYALRLVCHYRS